MSFLENCKTIKYFPFSLFKENYSGKFVGDILADDTILYATYCYVVDGHLVTYWINDRPTVAKIKERFGVSEIRRFIFFPDENQ